MSDAVKSTLLYLLVAYCALNLLTVLDVFTLSSLQTLLFALVIAGGAVWLVPQSRFTVPRWLLWLAIVFALSVRVLPYLFSPVPLGYDPGIHAYAFSHPFTDDWTAAAFPLPFLLLFSGVTALLGSWFVLVPLLILLSASTTYVFYVVAKKLYTEDVGVLAAALFAVSVVQYETFALNYYKNVLGILLLLLSLLVIEDNKRLNWKLIVLGVLIGGVHQVALFLFGLSYIVLIAWAAPKRTLRENCFAVGNGALMVAGIALTNFDRLLTLYVPQLLSAVTSTGAGTFLDARTYVVVSLAYLPFALVGLWRNRSHRAPVVMGLLATVIVIGGLFFHNRFIIYLDVLVILFAALGLRTLGQGLGRYWPYVLLAIGAVGVVLHALAAQASISAAEWDEIKHLEPPGTIVATDRYYSAWLKGYVSAPVVAPGLFDENRMNQSSWEEFWLGNDREYYLSIYDRPLYIHVGNRQEQYEFDPTCYSVVFKGEGTLYEVLC